MIGTLTERPRPERRSAAGVTSVFLHSLDCRSKTYHDGIFTQ